MSRLDEYVQLARERGLDSCRVEWRVNLIFATASLLGISPERIADDALDMTERNSCLPKSILRQNKHENN